MKSPPPCRLPRATLLAVAFHVVFSASAPASVAPTPISVITAEDLVATTSVAELTSLLGQRGHDPYSRSSLPDTVLRGIHTDASARLGIDGLRGRFASQDIAIVSSGLLPSDIRRIEVLDTSALVAKPTGDIATVVGYGLPSSGFNQKLLFGEPGFPQFGAVGPSNYTLQSIVALPPLATDSFLTGIATDASVATGYYRPSLVTGYPFVLRLPGGTPTDLPVLPGTLRTLPAKVSRDGSFIAGTTYSNGSVPGSGIDNSRLVRWQLQPGGYLVEDLGGFPGSNRTEAFGISTDGSTIVGRYYDSSSRPRPFRKNNSVGYRGLDIDKLLVPEPGEAIGTNNDGSLVVGESGRQAFRWSETGGMETLRPLTGAGRSLAKAITPSGSFIGGTSYDANLANPIAQIWTHDGGTIKLRDLLFLLGVDVSGRTFETVERIVTNAAGDHLFVGNGTRNGVAGGYAFAWKRPAGPAPAVATQPKAQAAATGGTAIFNVTASGDTSYIWRRNGQLIPGATDATLRLTNVQAADAGDYDVIVRSATTGATGTSETARLTVAPTIARLNNLSVRSTAGTGANTLIVGLTTAGGTKDILLRGIGPTLGQFGVPGTLADPQLALFNSSSVQTAQNDDWGGGAALSSAFSAVGAFPLAATSKDAALLAMLAPGGYSAQVSGAAGTTGVVLVESYDSDIGSPLARYTNLSARNQVGTGANILIVGFNLTGNGPKNLLIRAVGPTLSQFGVPGTLADPQLAVFNSGGTQVNQNDDWGGSGALASAFTAVGAFPLAPTSKDAALSVVLQPGSYTAQVSGVNNTTGVALVEIYELP